MAWKILPSMEYGRFTFHSIVYYGNYCVDILKARWLHPAFAEMYRLLLVTLSKELVAVHV